MANVRLDLNNLLTGYLKYDISFFGVVYRISQHV